jgi:diketogulonate reductase-like aldo/keto reductase
MEYKQLGNTGYKICEVGLGTSKYTGGPEPLRKGIELGASHIDTAEDYETEDQVGEAVAGMRDRAFIATKVFPNHFRYSDVLEAAANSLRQLSTDYIDLYQLHKPNDEIPIEETMRAMDKLVDDGKVRYLGVSNFSIAQLEAAQSATRYQIVSNQVRYSLGDRRIEDEVLPYCQENNVTVIAYSSLAALWGFSSAKTSLQDEVIEAIAKETNKTRAQVALNWCTSQEGVVVIPKSDSVERTVENCGASGWRLTTDQVNRLDEAGVNG